LLIAAPDGTNRKILRMATTATDLQVKTLYPIDHPHRSVRDAAIPKPWAAVVFAALAMGAATAEKHVPGDPA
jgi:hypothetical protein